MTDVMTELEQVKREVATTQVASGEARIVRLSRTYEAPIDDVWDALTSAERINRWFLPISGDLHLGGHYQFEGNAGGEILECDEPNRFKVSWVFGEAKPGDVSEVEVRLTATNADQTLFELEHTATVPPEMWSQFGPGAVGVGWDGGVLGLALHLAGGKIDDPSAWMMSDEARRFYTRSSEAWGEANVAAGEDPATAAEMVRNSTEFYAPPQTPETRASGKKRGKCWRLALSSASNSSSAVSQSGTSGFAASARSATLRSPDFAAEIVSSS